jgi:integrase/recombinase XerC
MKPIANQAALAAPATLNPVADAPATSWASAGLAASGLSGQDHFEAWSALRLLDKHRKPMGASGLQQTELVWRKWLVFCDERAVDWKQAQAQDVRAFSEGVNPRTTRASRKVSPVTVKRYWRIVSEIYAFAVVSEVMEVNPAAEVKPAASERMPSLALTPNMWALLQEGLPGGHDYKDTRNRLVLLLLMRCALTVSEVLGLKISGATPHNGTPEQAALRMALAGLPLLQEESPFWRPLETHPTYALLVDGKRAVQKRQLVLDARTSKALHDWLAIRKLAASANGGKLILGDSTGQSITAKGLYNISHAHLQKCLAPANQILHLGPNTLRNTCIAIWANRGVPQHEILRRCGLKDAGVLTRLQNHLQPAVCLLARTL